jgi:galactoside O-acetyltransferase
MPNVEVGIGAAIGALSLVKKNVSPFAIIGGIPAKKIGNRNKKLLQLEETFIEKFPAKN